MQHERWQIKQWRFFPHKSTRLLHLIEVHKHSKNIRLFYCINFLKFIIFIFLQVHCRMINGFFFIKNKQKKRRKEKDALLWYFTLKMIKIYHLEKELQCFGSVLVIARKHKTWRQPLILIWLLQHILCTTGGTEYS